MIQLLQENIILMMMLIVVGYFFGNICAAVLISKGFIKNDIRQHGSKNPGTTNMTRVFGLKFGVLTFVVDFLKALIPTLLTRLLVGAMISPEVGLLGAYVVGLGVILGHNYPVILKFKGGKGFASGIGVFVVLSPLMTIIFLLIGLFILILFERMSIFALWFFLAHFVYSLIWLQDSTWQIGFRLVFLLLVIYSHRSNIKRLFTHSEPRLNIQSKLFKSKK